MSAPLPPPANPYAAPTAPTNSLAIVSIVLSAVGIMTFVTAIGGVICGHIALRQIAQTGEQGRGLALAGVILGYVICGAAVLGVIITIGLMIWMLGMFGSLVQSGSIPV